MNEIGKKQVLWRGVAVLLSVMLVPQLVRSELHVFSLPDGQVLEAKIVSFDAKSGRVVLERKDGKRAKVNPSGFVGADQQYIKEWVTANTFLSERTLKVECENRQVNKWKEKETRSIKYSSGDIVENFVHNVIKYEQITYEFTFENKAATSIQGLRLEYCIYYEQSAMSRDVAPAIESKTLIGKMDLPEIAAKNAVTVSTVPVMIYEDDINPVPQLGGDQRRPGEGEIVGIRARLIFKKGEEETVREIYEPDSLSAEEYPWTDKSSPNERKKSFSW